MLYVSQIILKLYTQENIISLVFKLLHRFPTKQTVSLLASQGKFHWNPRQLPDNTFYHASHPNLQTGPWCVTWACDQVRILLLPSLLRRRTHDLSFCFDASRLWGGSLNLCPIHSHRKSLWSLETLIGRFRPHPWCMFWIETPPSAGKLLINYDICELCNWLMFIGPPVKANLQTSTHYSSCG